MMTYDHPPRRDQDIPKLSWKYSGPFKKVTIDRFVVIGSKTENMQAFVVLFFSFYMLWFDV